MFKPPFTVIIIKKTREPMTVQVTYRLVFMALALFSLICIASGFGISVLLSRVPIPYLQTLSLWNYRNGSGEKDSPAPKAPGGIRLVHAHAQPLVGNLNISNSGQDKTGIEFSLTPVDSCDTMYVWLIINPDALPGEESAIYPRNPVYRGVPVDYRNGLEFRPLPGNEVRIDISDLISGTEFKTFKILAYSPDGSVLVNSVYEVTQRFGTS